MVRSLFFKGLHVHGVLNIADLGCAAGPNAFSVISTVKETTKMKSRELNSQTPELHFYLNDLPGNDFNTLFRGLSYDAGENSCFVVGVPGSFHGRLFPSKSLHLVHSSYSVQWLSQQKVFALTKPLLENAVGSLFFKGFHVHGVLNIADLGCAAGPNAFSVISTVKETIKMKSQELNSQTPELHFYLNDLPENDFNTLFRGLSYDADENSCFVAGVPGSFHGQLFTSKSLHLVHSSYNVHWLSQVPKGLTSREGMALNKGNIYISKTSSPLVREAYLTQFQEDFTKFLRSRAEEVVPNGCMLLILHGRQSPDPSTAWELVAWAIAALVSEGFITEEQLDSFNVPYYTPSAKEVQDVVEREGSFAVERIDTFAVHVEANLSIGEKFAKRIRAFTESIVTSHFGEELTEKIYNKLTKLLVEDLSKPAEPAITVIVVLNKNL